eukprot:GFUD01013785.1.p1 GENE.GFUD01013785.1~~GFUD01013785.1.p1  ORF type:complete len:986 (-),score=400.54 GFUD01013785.1:373-3291(-)
MSKRQADTDPAGAEPPAKKIVFEPLQLGAISNLEELDLKTLQFQNRKLGQRLALKNKFEEDLRGRIDQLEKRQTQDDAVINVINRYWNQLNEDIRILLQRFDAETGDELEKKGESEATTSFLTALSTWHKQELDEKLASRVQVSQRAVAKIIQVFDHLLQRNEKVARALRGEKEKIDESDMEGAPEADSQTGEGDTDSTSVPLDVTVKELNTRLQEENKNLHQTNTSLHEKNHFLQLRNAELTEQLNAETTNSAELENKFDDSNYELSKTKQRNEKLETLLVETQSELSVYVAAHSGKDLKGTSVMTCSERKTLDELQRDLEDQRELAQNRMVELDTLNSNYKECLQQVEKLKMELSTLPEYVVVETTEHKCLQSQFSVLYNEAMQLKTQLEENRAQLQVSKNAHMRQIEQMESEELLAQKKLRTEVIQLEDMLAQVRKEYEMLRIEFEQNLAANEQTGPINKEMRNLITSLQTHNVQLKGEVARYKRKFREKEVETAKLRKECDELRVAEIKALQAKKEALISAGEGVIGLTQEGIKEEGVGIKLEEGVGMIKLEVTSGVGDLGVEGSSMSGMDGELGIGGSPDSGASSESSSGKLMELKGKCDAAKIEQLQKGTMKDNETIKELKANLKKATNEMKERSLLLDMYKTCTKETRDKVALMAAEKKIRCDLEEARLQIKKMSETKKEEKKRLADEDATRRIKQLEDQVETLRKQVANHKQEEETLLSDMEVTGQAFEDMQDQNSRLIQQLREKDDANFKLMSERIKSNQIARLAREEKEMYIQQVATLTTQVEAQNQVVRKLEEKERLLQNNLATVEKELQLRQQAMEMHKRKAIESAQSAADLKLHLEKYHSQIKEVQQTVAEKTSALEAEAFKTKRMQEETAILKRKVERLKKIEMASDMDEILKEEIREYKETLTCPSCKVKRKDAILTKCFHVFCYDCLRTRYETRQRKCPKCNAAFGASDYHRLYLS